MKNWNRRRIAIVVGSDRRRGVGLNWKEMVEVNSLPRHFGHLDFFANTNDTQLFVRSTGARHRIFLFDKVNEYKEAIVPNLKDTNGNSFIVRPDHRFVKGAVSAIALAFCSIGGYSIYHAHPSETQDNVAVFYIVSTLWAAAIGLVFSSLLWTLFGARVVVIQDGRLMLRYQIMQLGIGKIRFFEISQIKDIRVEERIHKNKGKEWFEYLISIEYNGRREALLKQLSERQAKLIRAKLFLSIQL